MELLKYYFQKVFFQCSECPLLLVSFGCPYVRLHAWHIAFTSHSAVHLLHNRLELFYSTLGMHHHCIPSCHYKMHNNVQFIYTDCAAWITQLRGGALVKSMTLNRRVVGSTPTLDANYGPWASPLLTVACELRRETLIQYPCCSRERLWVVVDLKRRYRNGQNERMNELNCKSFAQ